jgi:hypothetical protein
MLENFKSVGAIATTTLGKRGCAKLRVFLWEMWDAILLEGEGFDIIMSYSR